MILLANQNDKVHDKAECSQRKMKGVNKGSLDLDVPLSH